jgi:hypothetical protein
MDDRLTEFERQLRTSLRRYVEDASLDVAPAFVVTDVVNRPRRRYSWMSRRRLLSAGVLAALVVGLVAVVVPALRPDSASDPSLARVNGVDYFVGPAPALVADEADLIPYTEIAWVNDERLFADRAAFRLRGVDPAEALVARAAPGAFPPETGLENVEFLLLKGRILILEPGRRPPSEELCRYLDLHHPTMRASEWCRPPEGTPEASPTAAVSRHRGRWL